MVNPLCMWVLSPVNIIMQNMFGIVQRVDVYIMYVHVV